MRWAHRDGTAAVYVGPLIDLGQGIPRPRSHRPLIYRMQRALWHLTFGYASGFPVRDIVAFTARGFWSIPIPTDAPAAIVEAYDPELSPSHAMTEDEYVELCTILASGLGVDAGIVEPVRPHWLVPLEPEEEAS